MPAHHAHYYFGVRVIRKLPEEIKAILNTNGDCIDAFLIALQGPDILAFHRPFAVSPLNLEGASIHHRSGAEFFRRAVDYIRENPSPEAYSYLIGFLCHYMLDSACHPLVARAVKQTGMSHTLVEKEFDRFLLARRGRCAIGQDTSLMFPNGQNLGAIISPFYYSAGPHRIRQAIADMKRAITFLNHPSDRVRKAEARIVDAFHLSRTKHDMIATRTADARAAKSNRALFAKLNETVPETVAEIVALLPCIEGNAPLSERLRPDFLGKMPH